MSKLIIGLTGEMGSGKTFSAKYLVEKHGAVGYRFSTPMRKVAADLGVTESRENLQKVSEVLRRAFGEDVWAKVIARDTLNTPGDLVVIEGVRRVADIAELQKLPQFRLVYLEAPLERRYERITKRGENADDLSKTFAQFEQDQKFEAETQIRSLKATARVVIDNGGSPEELKARLDKLVTGQ